MRVIERNHDTAATQRFKDRKMEVAQRLAGALMIKTVTYDQGDVDGNKTDYSQFIQLHKYFQTQFPLVHKTLERHVVDEYNLVYIWEGSDPTLKPYLLYAHQDVVPTPGEKDGKWSVDPFGGDIKPGMFNSKEQLCAWGRGAIDDKQACLAYFEAIEDLLQTGFKPSRTVYLCMGHDEETEGTGAIAIGVWLEERLGPKAMEFVCDEGMFVIDEALPGLSRASAFICVAEKGDATLMLSMETDPGHASSPPTENGCIGVLSQAVRRLEDNPGPIYYDKTITSDTFSALKDYLPLPGRYLFSNMWLFSGLVSRVLAGVRATQSMVRTTTALTIFRSGVKVNVLPSKAVAYVNHRVHPEETVQDVIDRDTRLIDDPRVKISIHTSSEPTPVTDYRSKAFADLKETTLEFYPDSVVLPSFFVANTDSRFLLNMTDQVYRYNPIRLSMEDVAMFHGFDERISVDTYVNLCCFWRAFIVKSDKRKVPQ